MGLASLSGKCQLKLKKYVLRQYQFHIPFDVKSGLSRKNHLEFKKMYHGNLVKIGESVVVVDDTFSDFI